MTSPIPTETPPPTVPEPQFDIAVLGLGEVGRIYAAALAAAGHRVTGYDPYNTQHVEGVTILDSIREAVNNADMVFTLTPAAASRAVAQEAVTALPPVPSMPTSPPPDPKQSPPCRTCSPTAPTSDWSTSPSSGQ